MQQKVFLETKRKVMIRLVGFHKTLLFISSESCFQYNFVSCTKCIINFLLCLHNIDRDRLYYVVYEKKALTSETILPNLWTYRSRITLEHLLQMTKNQKKKCPILLEFLNEVSDSATLTYKP